MYTSTVPPRAIPRTSDTPSSTTPTSAQPYRSSADDAPPSARPACATPNLTDEQRSALTTSFLDPQQHLYQVCLTHKLTPAQLGAWYDQTENRAAFTELIRMSEERARLFEANLRQQALRMASALLASESSPAELRRTLALLLRESRAPRPARRPAQQAGTAPTSTTYPNPPAQPISGSPATPTTTPPTASEPAPAATPSSHPKSEIPNPQSEIDPQSPPRESTNCSMPPAPQSPPAQPPRPHPHPPT